MEEQPKDNTKLFKKIVRDHNAKTGFSFVLPKDTDYTTKYAHPVHDDGVIKITSQTDDENKKLYAFTATVSDCVFRVDEDTEYATLKEVIATDDFKYRLGALKQLKDLYAELSDAINALEYSVFTDSVTAAQKEDTYDLVIRTARKLYKVNN